MKAREREGGRGLIHKRFGGGVLLDLKAGVNMNLSEILLSLKRD